MERGWDPEIKKYFKKVLFSVCYGLIWMLTMVTLGLYYQLAYSAGKPIIYTILFYAFLAFTLGLLLRYYYRLWKSDKPGN